MRENADQENSQYGHFSHSACPSIWPPSTGLQKSQKQLDKFGTLLNEVVYFPVTICIKQLCYDRESSRCSNDEIIVLIISKKAEFIQQKEKD